LRKRARPSESSSPQEMELPARIELALSALPKRCFTTKLRQLESVRPAELAALSVDRRDEPQMRSGPRELLLGHEIHFAEFLAEHADEIDLAPIRTRRKRAAATVSVRAAAVVCDRASSHSSGLD